MDEEIQLAPFLFEPREHRVDSGKILNVAGQDETGAQLLGERLHALAERFALIGEGELCPMAREHAGDAIGDRMVIGDAHYEPALPLHQTSRNRHFHFLYRRRVHLRRSFERPSPI